MLWRCKGLDYFYSAIWHRKCHFKTQSGNSNAITQYFLLEWSIRWESL